MPVYRLYLFGAPRLEHLDQPVAIDTRKALALLAYLFIEEQPQSRDTLAALLWPESDQSAARAALRRTLSTLRSSLAKELFDFGREILALQPGNELWCDVAAFHTHLAGCRTHGHPEDQACPQCLAPLTAAAELYTADFMAGFSLRDSAEFDDWQFFEADRLRRQLMSTLECLVSLYMEQNEFTAAIPFARRWLSLDTLNEAAHRALITLYAQSDQRNAALRQYRECVRILDGELGVAPLPETTQLYEAAKEHRLEMPLSTGATAEVDNQDILNQNSTAHTPSRALLIGRTVEWEQITQVYESLRPNGAFVALTGEAGIGKTHFSGELIASLQSRGAVTLSARCYAGESNLAYAPLIDLIRKGLSQAEGKNWWLGVHPRWLSEVAILVPEISTIIPDIPATQRTQGPGAQSRFYEGVCQVLTALVSGFLPGLIFIDNLEWADESTLDLLAYLARRLQNRPFLLIVAWQTSTARLEQVLNEARQQGVGLNLPLSPLKQEDALALIEQLENNSQPFSPDFKQQLLNASQGLPYFLVSYLQAALEGKIRADMAASYWPIPVGLREMLRARLANLSGLAMQMLQAAAIIGRTFESDLLQTVSGRSEDEIIQGIEELLCRDLIREIPPQTTLNQPRVRYDFKQEQVRVLVLDEMSLVRQRLLHRRVAEALVEQTRLPLQRAESGQIALHYHQAGLAAQAAEYYVQAGRMARAIHANADALAHFKAALALGYPQRTEVLVEIGDLHTLEGDYPQAIQQYEAAAASSSPDLLAVIEHKIGRVYLRRGSWEQATCHFEAALHDLETLPPEQKEAFEAEVRVDWSLACHREGITDQALGLAQAALALAEASGDLLALAQVHNLLGILARGAQQPGPALDHLNQSLAFARQLDNPGAQIAALNNLALAQADQEVYEQAISTLEGALDECRLLGDRHLEAALCNNLADVLRAGGQTQAAMTRLKQAVAIFAEIGQNAEDWEPEIWKLTEW